MFEKRCVNCGISIAEYEKRFFCKLCKEIRCQSCGDWHWHEDYHVDNGRVLDETMDFKK